MIAQLQHYAQPPFKKGYQHILLKEGYIPDQQRGHQPVTSQRVPANPPSNPPNQGTGGRVAEIASLTRHRNLVEGLKGVECLYRCQSFDGSSGLS